MTCEGNRQPSSLVFDSSELLLKRSERPRSSELGNGNDDGGSVSSGARSAGAVDNAV